jgi:hypothetical protein
MRGSISALGFSLKTSFISSPIFLKIRPGSSLGFGLVSALRGRSYRALCVCGDSLFGVQRSALGLPIFLVHRAFQRGDRVGQHAF